MIYKFLKQFNKRKLVTKIKRRTLEKSTKGKLTLYLVNILVKCESIDDTKMNISDF